MPSSSNLRSQQSNLPPTGWGLAATSLSEEASHREHAAALEATLFRRSDAGDELVFVLDAGALRLHRPDR